MLYLYLNLSFTLHTCRKTKETLQNNAELLTSIQPRRGLNGSLYKTNYHYIWKYAMLPHFLVKWSHLHLWLNNHMALHILFFLFQGTVDIIQKYPVPECDIWFIKLSCDFHYNAAAIGISFPLLHKYWCWYY